MGAHFLVDAITSASIAAGHHRRQRLHRDPRRGRAARAQALGTQRSDASRTSTAPSRTTGRTASGRRTARASGTTRRRSGSRSGAASTRCRRRAGRRIAAPSMAAAFCTLNGWFGGRQLLAGAVAGRDRADQRRDVLPGRLPGQPLPPGRQPDAATSSCPSTGCATRSRRASPTTSRGPRPACSFTIASTSTSTRARPGRRPIRG